MGFTLIHESSSREADLLRSAFRRFALLPYVSYIMSPYSISA